MLSMKYCATGSDNFDSTHVIRKTKACLAIGNLSFDSLRPYVISPLNFFLSCSHSTWLLMCISSNDNVHINSFAFSLFSSHRLESVAIDS